MLVLVGDLDDAVTATNPTLAERIQARLRAGSLDRQLARGIPPETNVLLALRAERLVRPSTRRQLACSLRRIAAESARRPRGAPSALSLPARRRIRAAREPIEAVADLLQRRAPVPSRGVAQVCVLLTDGAGPIHGGGTVRDLLDRLQQVELALEPLGGW